MSQYRLVIDLRKCVGCGSCAMACKTGNNTQWRYCGQTFNWADFIFDTTGTFPNTKWQATPVNCNHCVNPECVAVCPVTPDGEGRKAVYKIAAGQPGEGIVMQDNDRCIGCRRCQGACPYSTLDVRRPATQDGVSGHRQYSVISFNQRVPHEFWDKTDAVITNGTATPAEVKAKAETAPPYRTKYVGYPAFYDVRRQNIVEKCTLCIHRILDEDLPADKRKPYCVAACPPGARQLLAPGDAVPPGAKVLKPGSGIFAELIDPPVSGLQPQIYYMNSFSER